MRKLKFLAFALSLALCALPLSTPFVLAAETTVNEAGTDTDATTENSGTDLPSVLDENGAVIEPGTLPDSPFYWLTTLIEKLQVILTTDPEKKTELLEEQALERIAEAEALIEKGDTEEAQGTLDAYTQKVTEAQAFLAKLMETDSETAQKLETALSQTHARNIQTLGGLLDKLPPQASEKVALNIVRSMEKSIAKMDKKEQQKVAKELRKATQNIGDSELTEEEQEALVNLDKTLELQDETEETVAATSAITLSEPSKITKTEKSKTNRQVTESGPKVEIEKAEQTEIQEQEAGLEAEQNELEQKEVEPKDNKSETGKEKAVSKEKNPNTDKAQLKAPKEREGKGN